MVRTSFPKVLKGLENVKRMEVKKIKCFRAGCQKFGEGLDVFFGGLRKSFQ